ncbi:hypothetical protein ACHAQA_009407 [Verticillium albo-atrum]
MKASPTTSSTQPRIIANASSTTQNATLAPARKRFIELCVNTGEFRRQLAEIDMTGVESDAEVFRRIRNRYIEVRSFRAKYALLKPMDVHFVQFSLEHRHLVGILDQPMSIPSQKEMGLRGYHYSPCPLQPTPPVPANIFLHYLLHAHETAHTKLRWGNRIPHKVDDSILNVPNTDELIVGWGVHIIEGVHKRNVLLATLLILLVSGIVAVTWAVVRDDVQGGFGIGAWVTSVQAVVLMIVFVRWNEA